jgi:hypothetical protein
MWDAAASNKEWDSTGLYRKNADKRRAVWLAWKADPNAPQRKIADQAGVSQANVSNLIKKWQSGSDKVYHTFNETNENVSWAKWTWNPVTGCHPLDMRRRRVRMAEDGRDGARPPPLTRHLLEIGTMPTSHRIRPPSRKAIAAVVVALALVASASGQHARLAEPAACQGSYGEGPLVRGDPNPDNTIPFTQQGVRTSCTPLPPPFIEAPCTFCSSFQLLQWGGGNVWVAIEPQYPVLNDITVACNIGTVQDFTNTTPPLGVGTWRMITYLHGGPCDLLDIGGIPVTINTVQFTGRPAP